MLESVRFALTGDSEIFGSKTDNIRIQSDDNSPAYVELTFEHNGKTCYIKRSLRPSSHFMSIQSGQTKHTFRKDKEINEVLNGMLAVPFKFLRDHVLVGQRNVCGFLSDSPTVTAELFANLFGVEKMSKIHDVLRDGEGKLAYYPVDAFIQECEREITRIDIDNLRLFEEVAKYHDIPDDFDLASTSEFKELVSYKENESAFLHQCKRVEELTCKKKDLQEVETKKAKAHEELEALREKWYSKEKRIKDIDGDIKYISEYSSLVSKIELLESEIRLKLAEKEKAIAPTYPFAEDEEVPTNEDVVNLRAEEKRLGNYIKTFSSGNPVCPTCASVVNNLDEVIKDYTQKLKQTEDKLVSAETKLSRLTSHEKAVQQYQYRLSVIDRDVEKLRTSVADIVLPEKPEKSLQELLDEQSELSDLRTTCFEAKRSYEGLVSQETRLGAEVKELEKTIDSFKEKSLSFSDEKYEELTKKVNDMQARWKEKVNYLTAIQSNSVALQTVTKRLEDLQNQARTNKRKESLLSNFKMLRELFHRDGLPKDVVRTGIDRLLVATNEILEKFDTGFRVYATDDLKFRAKLPGAASYDVRRLSEGQRALLALAARISATSLFASSLGLLAIDEPTASLDADNQRCISIAVDALRERSTNGNGLQVIVITHSKEVVQACDKVISLSSFLNG